MSDTPELRLGSVSHALAIALLSLAVLSAVLSVRAVLSSRTHLARGKELLSHNATEPAIIELREAARWRAPFNFLAQDALYELERVGMASQQRGELARSLFAYRSARAAIVSTRSFYTPDRERLSRITGAIIALEHRMPGGAPDTSFDPREAYALDRPRPLGALLAVLGYCAWVASTLLFLARGRDAHGALQRHVARPAAVAALVGFAAFMAGLVLT